MYDLRAIAHDAMIQRGLLPDFSQAVLDQTQKIVGAATISGAEIRDLRQLVWASIDNDDSRDLDQLSVAQAMADGTVRILVAIADVDELVTKNSAIDGHALTNTTSVYTAAEIFPMLPERLSTDLTSLGEGQERLAMVIDMSVSTDGTVAAGNIYRSVVLNRAKLAYNSVGAWLEGSGPAPAKVAANADLAAQLKLQDSAAQHMMGSRFQHGALDLETIETRPVMLAEEAVDIARQQKNRATSLIEEFMVAANGVIAKTFDDAGVASIRRIVRTPKRWDRIVEVADGLGTKLPAEPDSKVLNDFLLLQKQKDPDHFPDLSLTVVKLMGPGEYVLVKRNEVSPGHFGLAVQDYTHSTAPNRRFPDVVTQRLMKALITKSSPPYSEGDLNAIAQRCTLMEDGARKVEREMQKRIAAVVLHPRIGESFHAIVTGVNNYGTFVRALDPHVEGMLVNAGKPGAKGLDVGDRLTVKLVNTDPERGFIDFAM